MRLLLDANLLKRACHPRNHPDVKGWLQGWMRYAQDNVGVEIVISAVADYELRRGYLSELDRKEDERQALERLDTFCSLLGMQQVSARNFVDAATMWAQARRGGYSTAPDRDVDWDVLIAAQAKEMAEQSITASVVVVTENVKHLTRFGIDARDWDKIPVPQESGGA